MTWLAAHKQESSIYSITRYGVPIYFGTIPASQLNFKLDEPLIAAGLYSLQRFGLRDATTNVSRIILLYKKGAAVSLTFHNFKEADTMRVDYGALELRERLSRHALGEQADLEAIEFELDLQGIAIDQVRIDISETSLRTLAFLRGLLSTMATEFQRDIIHVCRRGLSYTQYLTSFEQRMKQVLQRVAKGVRTKRGDVSEQSLLRDYEKLLEMQVVWNPIPKVVKSEVSYQKKVDLGVRPDNLARLIIATKSMLEEIFESIYGADVEFLIIDLENDQLGQHRVFVAYQKGTWGRGLYGVQIYRITEKVSSYSQETAILQEARTTLPSE